MADVTPTVTVAQVTEFVTQTSRAIGLPLRPEDLPGVLENTARLHTLAKVFVEFPLPDEVETAGVFQP